MKYEEAAHYFENLTDKEIAYLELLETKHSRYRDNYTYMYQFNPVSKQEFINKHLSYLTGDEEGEYKRALDYYSDAKFNSTVIFGGILTLYSLYKIGTTPKTAKMSRFMFKGTFLGFFGSGLYIAYEHNQLTNILNNMFINIMQRKIKERTTSKLN